MHDKIIEKYLNEESNLSFKKVHGHWGYGYNQSGAHFKSKEKALKFIEYIKKEGATNIFTAETNDVQLGKFEVHFNQPKGKTLRSSDKY